MELLILFQPLVVIFARLVHIINRLTLRNFVCRFTKNPPIFQKNFLRNPSPITQIMDTVGSGFNLVTQQINRAFGRREPWQVATMTATTILTLIWLSDILSGDKSKTTIYFIVIIQYVNKKYLPNRHQNTNERVFFQNDTVHTISA